MLTEQPPIRGFLCSVGLDPEILVEFQFNPMQIADKRTINYATISAPAQLLPIRQYNRGGDRTLSFTVRLDGLFRDDFGTLDNELVLRRVFIAADDELGILPELNKYRAFLYPRTDTPNTISWEAARESFVPLYSDTQQFTSPPRCLFGLGLNRVVECIVTEVNVTETLFAVNLAPLRADVAVTLVEYSPYETITEPPVGG